MRCRFGNKVKDWVGGIAGHGPSPGVFDIRTNGYPMGVPCGFVDIVGDVYNAATAHIGFVDVDGTIYDFGMLRVGSSNSNGEVRDLAGNQIASVHLSLHQKVHKKDRRPMHFRVAGAIMFLINP
jgi:hypothetical protein